MEKKHAKNITESLAQNAQKFALANKPGDNPVMTFQSFGKRDDRYIPYKYLYQIYFETLGVEFLASSRLSSGGHKSVEEKHVMSEEFHEKLIGNEHKIYFTSIKILIKFYGIQITTLLRGKTCLLHLAKKQQPHRS